MIARKLGPLLTGLALAIAAPAHAVTQVNVTYFLEWAMPYQEAKVKKTFDKAMGAQVNWTSFDAGTQMTQAMMAGEIDIAHSQGLSPFINAVNANAPIRLVAIAARYTANDCVVRHGEDISTHDASGLEGKAVAVPLATMADYSFRMMMRALGVNVARVRVLDQVPADAAVSLEEGKVVMAYGFGANSMARMYKAGKPLMSAAEKDAAGIISFDVVSVTERFARQYPDLLRRFLEVVHAANAEYRAGRSDVAMIARDAGMSVEGAKAQLEEFIFPTPREQLERYFNPGGLASVAIEVVGNAFATPERPALPDYSVAVDTSFLQ